MHAAVCCRIGNTHIQNFEFQGENAVVPHKAVQQNLNTPLTLGPQAVYDSARVPEDCVEILTAVKMIIRLYAGESSQPRPLGTCCGVRVTP